MIEQIFSIIKPDGVERNLIGKIISKLEETNLEKYFGEGNECIDGMNKFEFGHSKLMTDYLSVRRCWQMNR